MQNVYLSFPYDFEAFKLIAESQSGNLSKIRHYCSLLVNSDWKYKGRTLSELLEGLKETDDDIVELSYQSLIHIGVFAVPGLLDLVSSPVDVDTTLIALKILGEIGDLDNSASFVLSELALDDNQSQHVRLEAINALGHCPPSEVTLKVFQELISNSIYSDAICRSLYDTFPLLANTEVLDFFETQYRTDNHWEVSQLVGQMDSTCHVESIVRRLLNEGPSWCKLETLSGLIKINEEHMYLNEIRRGLEALSSSQDSTSRQFCEFASLILWANASEHRP